MPNEKIATPEGGWLGSMIRAAQESKSEDEFDQKLAQQLEAHQADRQVWDLLARYDWKSAKRAAFCSPGIRMIVERSILKEVL